jgi:hypothetical protein
MYYQMQTRSADEPMTVGTLSLSLRLVGLYSCGRIDFRDVPQLLESMEVLLSTPTSSCFVVAFEQVRNRGICFRNTTYPLCSPFLLSRREDV